MAWQKFGAGWDLTGAQPGYFLRNFVLAEPGDMIVCSETETQPGVFWPAGASSWYPFLESSIF